MSEILSDIEITELTGFKRPKEQKEWLLKNKWPFSIKRNGHPSVHRLILRKMLGVPISENGQPDKEEEYQIDLTKVG